MGKKKDIGAFIESKLDGGKSSPNEKLWDRVNHSLDSEKYTKRNHLYWIAGGLILLSIGLFLVANENFLQTDLPAEEQNVTITTKLNPSSGKDHNKTTIPISKEDSLNFKKEEEIFSEITLSEECLEKIETEDSPKTTHSVQTKDSGNKSKKDKLVNDSGGQNFTVTTKYYYYNSEDEKQMVTTDKNKIDSLMSRKQNSLDSINAKKIDSLSQKIKP
ncbi:hypothetical protein EI546_14455 [Aequorivita sp. H23M31]|uniref:Uncharacterized protein n=1 Tax=Aequorivita ciconiae TaxID=2494375 RepID=A0A410G6C7_9FLAO|nr:hypothetical protein [Aequorivita sp. H23M31]QAA82844.1 hypothetical protein EI546_14455 [Aequorivita sp. H23M31]